MWKKTPETKTDILYEWRPSRNAVFFVNDEGDRRFCNFMPSVHISGKCSAEEYMRAWPREAIRMMRAELDKIETILNQQEKEIETSVH